VLACVGEVAHDKALPGKVQRSNGLRTANQSLTDLAVQPQSCLIRSAVERLEEDAVAGLLQLPCDPLRPYLISRRVRDEENPNRWCPGPTWSMPSQPTGFPETAVGRTPSRLDHGGRPFGWTPRPAQRTRTMRTGARHLRSWVETWPNEFVGNPGEQTWLAGGPSR
jgi:hypothetical protein